METKKKRPKVLPSWSVESQPEFATATQIDSLMVWHNCPYYENDMFAVNVECELCGTSAPEFVQLAVKLGTIHTVSTILTYTANVQNYSIGWTMQG